MKQNEIMQALSLTKSKQTSNYCTKLANLFEFIKVVKDTVISAEIVGTGLTIDSNGKLLEMKVIEREYREQKLNHYRYNDKAMQQLTKEETNLRCKANQVREQLWKKRKNKDNSELEAERDNISSQLQAIDTQKEALISVEKGRLEAMQFDIAEMRKSLNLFEGNKINVQTNTGQYSFYLPVDNGFYYAVCRLLNVPFTVANVVEKTIKYKFITYPTVIDNIKKAAGFISKDDLRPAMQCVCLDFSKEGLQVVATDAHRMYYSKMVSFDGSTEDLQILIAPGSVAPLSKLKVAQDAPLTITVFNDNTATLNEFEVKTLPDTKFPQYRVVIPQYDMCMEFDKAELVKNVKKVIPYANKVTSQVNFHLNGSIALHTEDVDFGFECDAEMPYISKQFPDTDIAFSGKLLTECLGIFKEKTVKMFTHGKNTHAAIFTNEIDNVLLMPLMINN